MYPPEPFKRVLISYRNKKLKKTLETVGYINMHGKWYSNCGNLLHSKVLSWKKIEE